MLRAVRRSPSWFWEHKTGVFSLKKTVFLQQQQKIVFQKDEFPCVVLHDFLGMFHEFVFVK